MNVYAEYSFYTSEYKGRASEQEFQSHIVSASAHVRRITFGRADDSMDMEEVKLATCAVCDVLLEDRVSRVNGKQISSETTDGYSVTYAHGDAEETQLYRKIYKAAELYLDMTGLLYAGVDA